MNQKKRNELEQEIAYFREQFQSQQSIIPLPPSLEGRLLAQRLAAQEEQRERVRRPVARHWAAMACSLALVACLSVWYVYQKKALPDGSLTESGAGMAIPQAAAYSLEEGAVADEMQEIMPEADLDDEGALLGSAPQMDTEDEDTPAVGAALASGVPAERSVDMAQETDLHPAESRQQLTQLYESVGDGETEISHRREQSGQLLAGLAPGEGMDTAAGQVTFEADGTLMLTDPQGQQLSRTTLPEGTGRLVVWDEMAAALVQGEDAVELTLYNLADYTAPVQTLHLAQQGELADCAAQGDRLMLLTWVQPQGDQLPWVQLEGEAEELEPGQVYLASQLAQSQPSYLVATLIQGEEVSTKAVLGEVASAFASPAASELLLTLRDTEGEEYSARLGWE